jgi:hypothetical protein
LTVLSNFAPSSKTPEASSDKPALTVLPALFTLPYGSQRKRTASVSDPAFLLDASERSSLEMPDLRAATNFYSVV